MLNFLGFTHSACISWKLKYARFFSLRGKWVYYSRGTTIFFRDKWFQKVNCFHFAHFGFLIGLHFFYFLRPRSLLWLILVFSWANLFFLSWTNCFQWFIFVPELRCDFVLGTIVHFVVLMPRISQFVSCLPFFSCLLLMLFYN